MFTKEELIDLARIAKKCPGIDEATRRDVDNEIVARIISEREKKVLNVHENHAGTTDRRG